MAGERRGALPRCVCPAGRHPTPAADRAGRIDCSPGVIDEAVCVVVTTNTGGESERRNATRVHALKVDIKTNQADQLHLWVAVLCLNTTLPGTSGTRVHALNPTKAL